MQTFGALRKLSVSLLAISLALINNSLLLSFFIKNIDKYLILHHLCSKEVRTNGSVQSSLYLATRNFYS